MKAHTSVQANKTLVKKPVKQFRCGKCKKAFPKGQGHNARTCGRIKTLNTPSAHNVGEGFAQRSEEQSFLNTPTDKVQEMGSSMSVRSAYKTLKNHRRIGEREGEVVQVVGELAELVGANRATLNKLRDNIDLVHVSEIHMGKDSQDSGLSQVVRFERRTGNGKEAVDVNSLPKVRRILVKYSTELDYSTSYTFSESERVTVVCINEDGYFDSFRGHPAMVEFPAEDVQANWWYKDGKVHNLTGPAFVLQRFKTGRNTVGWVVEGESSKKKELCEQAANPETSPETFYELCRDNDAVVRAVAAANPNCPPEWRTMAALFDD